MCVCEGETESGRDNIIKHNFVAQTWTRDVDFILVFIVFICLASVIVGFDYFSVVSLLK